MLFYWFLMVILKFSSVFGGVKYRRVIRQAGSGTCVDAYNRTGSCISVRSCPPLLSLLANSTRGQAATQFLRQSQCNVGILVNGQPQVCCSSDGMPPPLPPINSSPPTPSQTTTISTPTKTTSTTSQNPISTTPRSTQCGRTDKKTGNLVGARNSTLGDWPWMAALGYRNRRSPNSTIQFKCGGSLISNRWIVTAAHCILNIGSLMLTTVRLGDLDLDDDNNDGATPQDFLIKKIITHPYYVANPIQNDIALIQLEEDVTFTRLIRPICILSGDEYRRDAFYANRRPYIVGWGATVWRPMQTRLQDTQVDIVDNQLCARNYSIFSRSAVIDERVLCAGGGGKDACQGDSGGPLMMTIEPLYYLSGIVSFGIGCANDNYPGVYTRVAYFSDWIQNTTGIVF